MHQRHSAKSVPPALIDEGRRYFFYGGDDQLTQVVVSNAWMTDFQYDGQRRKRITRDYAWQNSTWIKTNEVRYVYDGMLVIQERDANNLPIKTYTRGLDVSGSLQGAGGIGGLLAMTDHKDISTRHYYYHGDANGNVTALINEQQVVMARYAYDPFGNQISPVGPVSVLNPYRFSSKEWQPNSGLYYYGYRFYEPNLQRWINQDPIGERGGLNLYSFVANSPCLNFDKDGRFTLPRWLKWGVGGAIVAGGTAAYYGICNWSCPRYVRAVLLGAERQADQITAGDGQHRLDEGGNADALTHCIAVCHLARDPKTCRTAQRALDVAMARENPNDPPGRMDSLNNIAGFTLGGAGTATSNCAGDCIRALNSGYLVGLDGNRNVVHIPPKEYYATP